MHLYYTKNIQLNDAFELLLRVDRFKMDELISKCYEYASSSSSELIG
jgi:hypothetical protein